MQNVILLLLLSFSDKAWSGGEERRDEDLEETRCCLEESESTGGFPLGCRGHLMVHGNYNG